MTKLKTDRLPGPACCRLGTQACYNMENCEILMESVTELQTLLLHNSHLLEDRHRLDLFLASIAMLQDLFAEFSNR